MNSRLQQFLELENLSPARLADILGIQRSGLSHILSGRNKPGYDFIFKLLTKFPSINAEWILTGKGKPYKELNTLPPPSGTQSGPGAFNHPGVQSTHQPYSGQPYSNQPLVDQPILEKSNKNLESRNDWDANSLFFSANSQITESKKTNLGTNNQSVTVQNNTSQVAENEINGTKLGGVHKERSVKRVIIFYSDGSFEELFPNK